MGGAQYLSTLRSSMHPIKFFCACTQVQVELQRSYYVALGVEASLYHALVVV